MHRAHDTCTYKSTACAISSFRLFFIALTPCFLVSTRLVLIASQFVHSCVLCCVVCCAACRVFTRWRREEPAGLNGSILSLTPFQQGVVSVSNSAVRLHSRGCLLRATFSGLVREWQETSSLLTLLSLLVLSSPPFVGMLLPLLL